MFFDINSPIWISLYSALYFGQRLRLEELRERIVRLDGAKESRFGLGRELERAVEELVKVGLWKKDGEGGFYWERGGWANQGKVGKEGDGGEERAEWREKKRMMREKKLAAIEAASELLKIETVLAVALTGSVAMANAKESDDLDLLIITKRNTLYKSRLKCYILAGKRGQKRIRGEGEGGGKGVKNTWCMNLFLDEEELLVREEKRNLYGALQLKTMKNLGEKKGCEGILGCLRKENAWVKEYYWGDIKNNWLQGVKESEVARGLKSGDFEGSAGVVVDWGEKRLIWTNERLNEGEKELAVNLRKYELEENEEKGSKNRSWGQLCEVFWCWGQWLFMWPKKTREVVTKKQIYFHPKKRRFERVSEWVEEWKNEQKRAFCVNCEIIKKRAIIEGVKNESEIKKRSGGDEGGKLRVSFLSGCFDILHTGHRDFINEVLKREGEGGRLVIGIESDERVRQLKGKKKPFYQENLRQIRVKNLFAGAEVLILPGDFGTEKGREKVLRELCVNKVWVSKGDVLERKKAEELKKLGIELGLVKKSRQISASEILRGAVSEKELIYVGDEKLVFGKGKNYENK